MPARKLSLYCGTLNAPVHNWLESLVVVRLEFAAMAMRVDRSAHATNVDWCVQCAAHRFALDCIALLKGPLNQMEMAQGC